MVWCHDVIATQIGVLLLQSEAEASVSLLGIAGVHDHQHPEKMPWRTLVVGLVHGLAGSAALIVLTASTLQSPWWGIAYVLAFGGGTTLGMGLLSAVIAAPISLTAGSLTVANRALQGVIGIATCAIGLRILVEATPLALASL